MRKILFLTILLSIVLSAGLYSQSLQNNEYYQKSVEYRKMAESALEEGEYDKSYEYAVKSREFAALSKAYIAEMVRAYRARTALAAAKERIELAQRINLENRDPDLFGSSFGYFQDAKSTFDAKNYDESLENSLKVIDLLKDIKGGRVLPAFYEVVLDKAYRDCLWKIAGYDFVYNDPHKWPELYKANKSTFKYPDNPDLIYPGQILKIPSLKGEVRDGTYRK